MGVAAVKSYLASLGSVHRYGEDAGTDWGDSAPGGVDLDIGGSPQFGPDGEMLNMNGTSDYAFKIGQSHMPSGNIQRSFIIGGKNHVHPATWVGFLDYGGTAAGTRFLVRFLPDRKLEILIGSGGNTWTSDAPIGVDLELWMITVTITLGGTTSDIKVYYKNVEVAGTAVGAATINTTSPSNLNVGLQTGTSLYYNGDMDFFEVFTGVLSLEQVETAWEYYSFTEQSGIRSGAFFQRDTYPGIIHQGCGRTNTFGIEDMAGTNDMLHVGSPDRIGWFRGIYLTANRWDGISERAENNSLAGQRANTFHGGMLVDFDNLTVSGAIFYVGNGTEGMRVQVTTSGTLAWNIQGETSGQGGSGAASFTGKRWVSADFTNVGDTQVTYEIRVDGAVWGSGTITADFTGGFPLDKLSAGAAYVAGAPAFFFGGDTSLQTFATQLPTAQQEQDFLDVLKGITEYLPPASTLGGVAAGVGFNHWFSYPSGRVLMDEVGEIDAKINGTATFVENAIEGAHRMSCVQCPDINGGIWCVPLKEADDKVSDITTHLHMSIGQDPGSDFLPFNFWGYITYMDAVIHRITGGMNGHFRSVDDGATHNLNVGSGSDFTPGVRQSFTNTLNRSTGRKDVFVGPTNTADDTDATRDLDEWLGDWWTAVESDTTPVKFFALGYGRMNITHGNHQVVDTEEQKVYAPPPSASGGRDRFRSRMRILAMLAVLVLLSGCTIFSPAKSEASDEQEEKQDETKRDQHYRIQWGR